MTYDGYGFNKAKYNRQLFSEIFVSIFVIMKHTI